MTNRRKNPDGLPFRLYKRAGARTTSFGYKLPSGRWEFKLSAPSHNAELVAKIRSEAIERANALNHVMPQQNTVAMLIMRYFEWQEAKPITDARKKASATIIENKRESINLTKVFGGMRPQDVKPQHIYKYLDARAQQGAPAKANKEAALLSAVFEYGRRLAVLETNPCKGIQRNPTAPKDRYVSDVEINLLMEVARVRKGSYLVIALSLKAAYLTVSRPVETRSLPRQSIKDDGLAISVAKRKGTQAKKVKLIQWSPELRSVINEALSLQKTASVYIFPNQTGGQYTRSGYGTILRRLMDYCEARAKEKGLEFDRFALADMRPKAVTDRVDSDDKTITNATGHTDERMVRQVYDRRKVKTAKATK